MSVFWKPEIERSDANSSSTYISAPVKSAALSDYQYPIYRHKNAILYTLSQNNITIIASEAGLGKSTQIPIYLKENGWNVHGYSIASVQPHRVGAIHLAKKVSERLNVRVGQEVGYSIRFENYVSKTTKVKFVSDELLIRETLRDPSLATYSVIIVDELQRECRSHSSEILLSILKKLCQTRKELKVILMISSLAISDDIDELQSYFKGTDRQTSTSLSVGIVAIQPTYKPSSSLFDVYYLEQPTSNYIQEAANTIQSIHSTRHLSSAAGIGDILLFLPHPEDIIMASTILQERFYDQRDIFIVPFHSHLSSAIQQAYHPTPTNSRKVVLTTNIALSSKIIPNIKFVIDTGFQQLVYYDHSSNITNRLTVPIDQQVSIQRSLYCLRSFQSEGTVFRLFTEKDYKALSTVSPTEFQRMNITKNILLLKSLRISNVAKYDFVSCPTVKAVVSALEMLYSLDAIDKDGNTTALGDTMAEMTVDLSLARALLLSYDLACSEEMLSIAAMSNVEYPFLSHAKASKILSSANNPNMKSLSGAVGELTVLEGDPLTALNIYNQFIASGSSKAWCQEHQLQYNILSRASEYRSKLKQILMYYLEETVARKPGEEREIVLASCGNDTVAIRKCLVAGYFINAAKLCADGKYRTVRGNVEVEPHASSVYASYGAPPEWVIYGEVLCEKAPMMRDLTRIDPHWLVEMAPQYYIVNKSI